MWRILSAPKLTMMKKTNAFIYNENSRIHTLGGKIIPSVSNIVAPLSMDYSKCHPITLERKKNLGIAFHECIRLFLTDDLDEASVDDKLIIPMQQFKQFWSSGCVEKNAIYDWKLRNYDPVCDPLRLSGYEGLSHNSDIRLVEEPLCNVMLKYCGKPDMITGTPPRKLIVVEFSLSAGYKVHNAERKQGWPVFRKMLQYYWKKKEFETLLKQWRESA